MYHNVITGKENVSKEWNCIASMFLTSFNVYFVFGYAYFMCICLKTAIWHFLAFWGTMSGFFWWRQVGNPVTWSASWGKCSCFSCGSNVLLCTSPDRRHSVSKLGVGVLDCVLNNE